MTTPDEYEAAKARHAWKLIHSLDRLHSELASLYSTGNNDLRRQAQLWSAIEEKEAELARTGYEYEGVRR